MLRLHQKGVNHQQVCYSALPLLISVHSVHHDVLTFCYIFHCLYPDRYVPTTGANGLKRHSPRQINLYTENNSISLDLRQGFKRAMCRARPEKGIQTRPA